MSSLVELFTPNRQVKAEKARAKSIAAAKMIPTRDETDALRHEGRGLKTWMGPKIALSSLGFQKIAKISRWRGLGKHDGVRLTHHFVDRYAERVLKSKDLRPMHKLTKRERRLKKQSVIDDIMNKGNDRQKESIKQLGFSYKGKYPLGDAHTVIAKKTTGKNINLVTVYETPAHGASRVGQKATAVNTPGNSTKETRVRKVKNLQALVNKKKGQ